MTKKTIKISVKVTAEESKVAMWEKLAADAGMDLSAWIVFRLSHLASLSRADEIKATAAAKRADMLAMHRAGGSVEEIAEHYGISDGRVGHHLTLARRAEREASVVIDSATPLKSLGKRAPRVGALLTIGITTIGDLCKLSYRTLCRVNKVGPKTAMEWRALLLANGLDLPDEDHLELVTQPSGWRSTRIVGVQEKGAK